MCYEPVAFVLAGAVMIFGILGNLNNAWSVEKSHGGLWMFCPDPAYPVYTVVKDMPKDKDAYENGDCQKYTKLVAEKYYQQVWVEIVAARVLLLSGIIIGVPIIIAIAFQMYYRVAFWATAVMVVIQLGLGVVTLC